MLVVWTGDISAYYVGRAIGKHKLAPRISPGKSWEGAGAAIIGSMMVGTLLLVYNTPVAQALTNWKLLDPASALSGIAQPRHNAAWVAVLASASINIAAQIGDLLESMM
jgi:phosphatidate cytidylyltransferase